jgi:hypothetical protein
MRRPWYVGCGEWALRGGWEAERDLICRARLRLFGALAIALAALVFTVGVLDRPVPVGLSATQGER